MGPARTDIEASAAGPASTDDYFLAAARQVGDLTLPGVPAGSLGRAEYDADDIRTLLRIGTVS